jgi:glucokinase
MADETILVGDAGGTNVRFALAHVSGSHARGGSVALAEVWKRPGADFPTFEDALGAYLAETNPNLSGVSFGLAGQVENGKVPLLNRGWTVDLARVRDRLKLSRIVVVNDFYAMARSAPELTDTIELSPGKADPNGSIAVGGPGTGFGVGMLRRYSGKSQGWVVVGGEGGHQTYAPQTDLEWKLLDRLRADLRVGPGDISNETVAAGAGFEPSLDAMHAIMGVPQRSLTPGQTIDMAKAGDPVCIEFCRIRAACVMTAMGNMALACGAFGGVFIAGGVSVHLEPWLRERAALDRFYNRGPRTELLRPIPIRLITSETAPLLGSAKLWLDERERGWL